VRRQPSLASSRPDHQQGHSTRNQDDAGNAEWFHTVLSSPRESGGGELDLVQLGVEATVGQEFVVRAAFG
jgi:hypothetical protein